MLFNAANHFIEIKEKHKLFNNINYDAYLTKKVEHKKKNKAWLGKLF